MIEKYLDEKNRACNNDQLINVFANAVHTAANAKNDKDMNEAMSMLFVAERAEIEIKRRMKSQHKPERKQYKDSYTLEGFKEFLKREFNN